MEIEKLNELNQNYHSLITGQKKEFSNNDVISGVSFTSRDKRYTVDLGDIKVLQYYQNQDIPDPKVGDILESHNIADSHLANQDIVIKMRITKIDKVSDDLYLDYSKFVFDMSYIIRPQFILHLEVIEIIPTSRNKYKHESTSDC